MIFVNAGALAALTAVALPLLIHLFSRRRQREIDFSTLKFLKRLERKRMRNVKLTELLLLLLRTLAVAFIVFAFCRPALQRMPGLVPGEANTAAAFLIDNSLVSQAIGSAGSVLSQERNRALEALNLLSAKDRVTLISASQPAKSLFHHALPGGDERIKRVLYELEPTDADADWSGALKLAGDFLQKSELPNKEVYLFSPFYEASDALDSALGQLPEKARVFRVEAGDERLDNLTITDTEVETRILQPGGLVTLLVKVANFGEAVANDVPLNLYLDDERVAQTELDLPPHSEESLRLKFSPKASGTIRGRVMLEAEDPLLTDNVRYFALFIPEKVEVYLAGEADEVRRVKLALKPGLESGYIVNPVLLNDIIELRDYPEAETIFLAGAKSLTSYQADLLRGILSRGGGFILSPSENLDAGSLNRELLQPIGAPQFGELTLGEATWGNIDYRHPLFEGVFTEERKVESPRFTRHFRLLGSGGSSVISFREGDAFLKEVPLEKGTLFLFSAGFGEAWGNISHYGIFAPLLYRLAVYSGSGNKDRVNYYQAGEPIEFISEPSNENFALTLPNQSEMELQPSAEGKVMKLDLPNTAIAGFYTLTQNGNPIAVFVVNPASLASRLERSPVWKHSNAFSIIPEKDLGETVSLGRLGSEIWRGFMIAGLFCLVVELFISRILYR